MLYSNLLYVRAALRPSQITCIILELVFDSVSSSAVQSCADRAMTMWYCYKLYNLSWHTRGSKIPGVNTAIPK